MLAAFKVLGPVNACIRLESISNPVPSRVSPPAASKARHVKHNNQDNLSSPKPIAWGLFLAFLLFLTWHPVDRSSGATKQ